MSAEEFLVQFDVYYNNVTSNQAPGLNAYEKSLFLTKGQDEILKNYFNPAGNKYQAGYDGNQKRQIDFTQITEVERITEFNDPVYDTRANVRSIVLPHNISMIINEKVRVSRKDKDMELIVSPISFAEYDRRMKGSYRWPLKNQAWRLITSRRADIVPGPNDTLEEYVVKFVRKPLPIIVGPLEGLTIDGCCFAGDGTENAVEVEGCELNEILHEEILQRAVELAKASWAAENTELLMQAGQRSE